MRIAGRFPDQHQVSAAVDSLRNLGLDRKDMIISDVAKETTTDQQRLTDEIMVQSERDSIRARENESYAQGVHGLNGRDGILVAVEIPKHFTSKVREVMEQSGAIEILQD